MSTAEPSNPEPSASDSDKSESGRQESKWVIAGLCTIVASSILVEVCLTKFVSYKVYHHFVYAIISTVILSAGFAGTCVHLFAKRLGKENNDPWNVAAKSALLYAITLIIVTVLFCWLPFDPLGTTQFATGSVWLRLLCFSAPLALYFFLFAIPFFFAGLCISCTLVISKRSAAEIYFYDLLAAALGAFLCPFTLEYLGGYGTILASAALGMAAFICYGKLSNRKQPQLIPYLSFAGAALLILLYPQWAQQTYGFDIRTMKNAGWQDLVLRELKGIHQTYWNAVARIDITNTGRTKHFETPHNLPEQPSLSCRFVLVDGAAPTRQLQVEGDLLQEPHLGGFLWASPYIANPNIKRSMIIGPGGGVDILIGKLFKIPHIDAVELNPSTYKHILLGENDSEANLYQPSLKSTALSEVSIHNTEARHFCTTMPAGSFDLIQATAVDTLTAITSGALSMVENYLYTSDAVKDYVRVLKPGGILSLTHWRNESPGGPSIRMFVTYLEYLDSIGVKNPGNCIVVTANDCWADEMMKTTPFTPAEVETIRSWAKAHGNFLLFDPYRQPTRAATMMPSEYIYSTLGFLSPAERKKALNNLSCDVSPVSDDKPFFYKFEKNEDFLIGAPLSSTPLAFICLVLLGSLALLLLPLSKLKRGELSSTLLGYGVCFSLAGFAFLLYETSIIQLFSVFVGGPVYSLSVVLVCVLAGYATGSWLSLRLKGGAATFILLAITIALMFCGLYLGLPKLVQAMMPLAITSRIAICAIITFATSLVVGLPVSLAMTTVKGGHGDVVAWMWGLSCASNALGAMSFGLITQSTGISAALAIVAILYLLANLGFASLSHLNKGKA